MKGLVGILAGGVCVAALTLLVFGGISDIQQRRYNSFNAAGVNRADVLECKDIPDANGDGKPDYLVKMKDGSSRIIYGVNVQK